jgi:hypothetical protein
MHSAKYLVRFWLVLVFTVATDEILCVKNVGAWISMLVTSTLIAIKKNKNGGHFGATSGNPAHIPQKWANCAELALLFGW